MTTKALAGRRLRYRLRLVPVKRKWLIISAEDLRRGLVQGAVADPLIDRCSVLKVRIDGDERLWPKSITRIDRFDLGADICCPNFTDRYFLFEGPPGGPLFWQTAQSIQQAVDLLALPRAAV